MPNSPKADAVREMSGAAVSGLRERLEKEVASFQGLQKAISAAESARQTCSQQFSENDAVARELERLPGDAAVFKLVGPTLVRQDTVEAATNVAKRLQYIQAERRALAGGGGRGCGRARARSLLLSRPRSRRVCSDRLEAQLTSLEAKQTAKQAEVRQHLRTPRRASAPAFRPA